MLTPLSIELLFGPYRTPRLYRGDRASCLFRDCDVVVTGWSEGLIAWPRCRALGSRGGCGLLVDAELARAIRRESSRALQHHFGVSEGVVWRWRQALGVGRLGTEGSRRLHRRVCAAGAAAVRGRPQSREAVEKRMRTRRDRGIPLPNRWADAGGWSAEQIALLGTRRDAEVARLVGRSASAVRNKRRQLGIPTVRHDAAT